MPRDAGGGKLLVEYCIRVTAGWQIADVLQPFARGAAAILEKSAFTAEPFLCIAVRRSFAIGCACHNLPHIDRGAGF